MEEKYRICPVCGSKMGELPCDICPTCNWEQDECGEKHPAKAMAPNNVSLNQARKAWKIQQH